MRIRSAAAWGVAAMMVAMWPLWVHSANRPQGDGAAVKLPGAATSGGMSLTEALATRRSHRSFDGKPLSAEQISQLCWAAQGVTDPESGKRTAPSALKLFAIRVLVVDDSGAYEYVPASHALRRLEVEDAHAKLREVIASPIASAPLHMVVAMEPERLKARCGNRAERFSLLEAGHVAQNVLLQATALGLAGVPAGGIDEGKTAAALGLAEGLRPVYVIPVGRAVKN